jgi:peptidylprolyl isomerase
MALRSAWTFVLAMCACAPADSLVTTQTLPVDPLARSAPPAITSASANPNASAPPDLRASYSPVQGLDIEDLVIGTGREVKDSDRISVLYEGTLEDGTVFDSTATRGNQPATFPLGRGSLIRGWEIGLLGMRVGGKRKLTISPELAYGRTGRQGAIPPGSTLIFVIELVDVL